MLRSPPMRRAPLLLMLMLAPVAGRVGAETTKPFPVSAQVVAGCLVAADAAGRWGTIDLGTAPGVAGTGVQGALMSGAGAGIAIECTPGLAATLAADGGDHASGTARRLMLVGGDATIAYTLHADGAAAAWTGPLPLTFAAGRRFVPVRAVALLASPVPAGAYADTVRVTLSW